jgi:hypothetical protein
MNKDINKLHGQRMDDDTTDDKNDNETITYLSNVMEELSAHTEIFLHKVLKEKGVNMTLNVIYNIPLMATKYVTDIVKNEDGKPSQKASLLYLEALKDCVLKIQEEVNGKK